MATNSFLIAHANRYEALGHIVFGVNVSGGADGKKVMRPPNKWSSFTLQDPQQSRIKKSHNGLALRTGEASGILVLDIDDTDSFAALLEHKAQEEPVTATQKSQSGGSHYFFRYEQRFDTLRSSSKVLKDQHGKPLDIDLRGTGGMILVAPTEVHYPDGNIGSYAWRPGKALVGPDAVEPAKMPEWLWEALVKDQTNSLPVTAKRRVPAAKTSNGGTSASSPSPTDSVPASLADFVMENFSFLPEQLEKLVWKPDSRTFIVQTSEKMCLFYRKAHSSNHQYFVIHANGEITRQCHDGDCKGKQHGKRVLDDEILHELQELFPDTPVVDMALVEQAREEAKQNAIELYNADSDLKMDRCEDTLQGDMSSFLGNVKCIQCKNGCLACVTTASGTFVKCKACSYRFPTGSNMIPFDAIKYPNLSRFFVIIVQNNIQNNNTTNYYGKEESAIGWNEFAADGLTILESDSDTNLLLLKSLAGTQTRIADIFYVVFGSQYMFGNNQWYRFESPVWAKVSEADIKFDVRSNAFLGLYTKALEVYKAAEDISQKEPKLKAIQGVINKLETDSFKGSVVNEIVARYTKQFPEFLNKLDQDKGVLAFTNGVVDLATGEFRDGLPSDFVSRTVGYDYDHPKMTNQEMAGEILDFFAKVFPDPELMEYVLKFLASLLAGYTKDQLFHFGFGTGSNGKGVLLQLMQAVLGDLAQKAESTFICGAVPDANAPTPALTALVGRRFVYISEVIEGAKINESLFKQLSGQDRLTYRPLYGEARTFLPDFKLFMVCNDLPKFNGADQAMKRRVRVIPFVSTFTDSEPESTSRHIFAKDDTLIDRIDTWKHAMMGLLLGYYRKYLDEGLKQIPSAVAKFTEEYQTENDLYRRFVNECLVRDVEPQDQTKWGIPRVRLDEVFTTFEQWKAQNDINEKHGRTSVIQGVEKVIFNRVRDTNDRKIPFPGQKNWLPGLLGWRFQPA